MIPKKWKDLTPEEKRARKRRQAAQKAERTRREKQKEARLRQRYADDDTCAKLKPGDWMRCREGWGLACLQGKVVRFLDWDDDGYNKTRAPRNKRVIVEVEAHLYDEPERQRCKLWGFEPVCEMEVIAEAAR